MPSEASVMTAESQPQKRPVQPSSPQQDQRQQQPKQKQQEQEKKTLHLNSVDRIIHLPMVDSAHQFYGKIKESSFLVRWSLLPAETGVWLAVSTALPVVTFFQRPVSAVDGIVCSGLDLIEANLPVVKLPPEDVYNITKEFVTENVVHPMLKRADSVKQMSISGVSICGEMAANGLNTAIDIADKYVDKYLPEIADGTDSAAEPTSQEPNSQEPAPDDDGKAVQTMQHVHQFGRKLQRRLTRRTLAEAKALKQQGSDTIRCLVYLIDLLARDPKAFAAKMKEVWAELSKDEPENQVPPANLEQLISMLTREVARRVVHFTNYTGYRITELYQNGLHGAEVCATKVVWWVDYVIKTAHVGWAVDLSVNIGIKLHKNTVDMIVKMYELLKHLQQKSLQLPEVVVSESTESTASKSPSQGSLSSQTIGNISPQSQRSISSQPQGSASPPRSEASYTTTSSQPESSASVVAQPPNTSGSPTPASGSDAKKDQSPKNGDTPHAAYDSE